MVSQMMGSPQLRLVVYPILSVKIPQWMYEVLFYIPNVHRGISIQHQQVRLDRRKQDQRKQSMSL